MLGINQIIEGQDIIDLEEEIDKVLGVGTGHVGYGQTSRRTHVTGETIDHDHLDNAMAMLNKIRTHQMGLGNDFSSDFIYPAQGQPVAYESIKRLYELAEEALRDSLLYHFTSMTVTGTVHTSNRGRSWGPRTTISTELDIVWPSEDQARWFFNSGGEIRLQTEHPVVSTTANRSWNTTLNKVGTLRFAAIDSKGTNTAGVLKKTMGYYSLTDTLAMWFDGTNLDSSWNHLDGKRPGYVYGYKDDVYVYARKIPKGLRMRVALHETNNQVVSSGTSVRILLQYASQHLRTPNIVLPTITTSKSF